MRVRRPRVRSAAQVSGSPSGSNKPFPATSVASWSGSTPCLPPSSRDRRIKSADEAVDTGGPGRGPRGEVPKGGQELAAVS